MLKSHYEASIRSKGRNGCWRGQTGSIRIIVRWKDTAVTRKESDEHPRGSRKDNREKRRDGADGEGRMGCAGSGRKRELCGEV